MPDEPQTPPPIVPPPTETLGNDPSARNPDGSIKDTQTPISEPKKETPTEEKKPDVAKTDDKKPVPKEGAPEKYETFKAPEGYELDDELIAEVTPVFKELGLNQEQSQKLVDFYSKKILAVADGPYEQFVNTRNEWRKGIIASDLGNGTDGLKPEVLSNINRAIEASGPTIAREFREAMAITGAGDNPAFVKAFNILGSLIGEGTLVRPGNPSPGGQNRAGQTPSAAQALYPNLPSNAR